MFDSAVLRSKPLNGILLFLLMMTPSLWGQASGSGNSSKKTTTHHAAKKGSASKRHRHIAKRAPIRVRRAFVASEDLRPMAQQLMANRTPVAYGAVEKYAKANTGESAALAWLAIGYAHGLDQNCAQAVSDYWKAKQLSTTLGDYLDFFAAQCYQQMQHSDRVKFLLTDFDKRYPDSPLIRSATILLGDAYLALGDPRQAIKIYESNRDPIRPDLELALAHAYAKTGDTEKANAILQHLYLSLPLSDQASIAGDELRANQALPFAFDLRKKRADLLLSGKKYPEAEEEFQALLSDPNSNSVKADLWVSLASCFYHMKRMDDAKNALSHAEDATGETGAERLYLLAEIARDHDDGEQQRTLVEQMKSSFPRSPWTEDALLSSYNMYLLRKDFDHAIQYATDTYQMFPRGRYAHSMHWKAAWLSLRTGKNQDAGRLFEEQIAMYPTGPETPAALYWRGRLWEEDNDFGLAKAYYEKLDSAFLHYYYADLARERLAKLTGTAATHLELLDDVSAPSKPALPEVPEDDLHLARARLLANAGLSELAGAEIMSDAQPWSPLALSELYASAGLDFRALEVLKHAIPSYYALNVNDLPKKYWNILFPQSFWSDIQRYSAQNGLDAFLVVSLIRQESEFNPGAVSRANAYGLMQLLPKVGKGMAKELKLHHFDTGQLLDPSVNIELGTHYFRHLSDKFGGSIPYALASYNAGSNRVEEWQNDGKYRDIYEFIESIPFTETREYVQAILRNASIYRELYEQSVAAAAPGQ